MLPHLFHRELIVAWYEPLRIDDAHSDSLYRDLKDMPSIAGVSLKSESRAAFQKMLDSLS